ncbi:hypothetical protein TRAPUB_191 [Trametes pubescens]|uniref:Uncharacterized protein n=1 Tax=Trametes pubescens TaxID=154538 RepID=A0A1M2VMW8_TRAPU|nr:hypothetical protein TRAPUB_191 [Trametes pubescens]
MLQLKESGPKVAKTAEKKACRRSEQESGEGKARSGTSARVGHVGLGSASSAAETHMGSSESEPDIDSPSESEDDGM